MTAAAKHGAAGSAIINVSEIIFRPEFRAMCKDNRCGNYGRNWRCPPDAGEIEDLICRLKRMTRAMVFKFVWALSRAYDWKGMTAGGKQFSKMVQKLALALAPAWPQAIVLGAGPCHVCPECAIITREPCRYPEGAITSLEASGVDVSQLAKLGGLKYNNGPKTVTYFGAVFI
jgi:predicted metal-binding protein